MKILDWMHRKLQPATNYSRVFNKKAPAFEDDACDLIGDAHSHTASGKSEPDTDIPLLLHVNLSGILTIGTLGHSNPLFLPHFPEENTKLESPKKEISAASKPRKKTTLLQPGPELFIIKTEHSVEVDVSEEKIMAEPLLKEDGESKERTTLADLLFSEPVAEGDEPSAVAAVVPTKFLHTSGLKSGGKEKKKKGDDLEPLQSSIATKRIHRMITKMVKKKIHPEIAATGRKAGGPDVVRPDVLLLIGVRGGGGGGGGA